ncbi:T9SS type A sorting domain-containing protein, partial [candidate division WOR-3 bacterium]|nr:T9SS type A sorting domain-containing protein [candidate division WOR-3 bacterium]
SDLPSCPGNPLAVSIGPGRNDGINRLYVSTRQRCHEFTYGGGNWTVLDILPSLGAEERYDICLGRTKTDSHVRAYITCSGTQFLETSWNGSTWVDTVVDAVSAATCGVHIGPGRNDDTVRVYGCNRNGDVYEFTHSEPYVGIREFEPVDSHMPVIVKRNRPNPFSHGTIIEYTVPWVQHVRIAIHSVTGEKLVTILDEYVGSGDYSVEWTACDRSGKKLPAGVYICRLQTDIGFAAARMLLIR